MSVTEQVNSSGSTREIIAVKLRTSLRTHRHIKIFETTSGLGNGRLHEIKAVWEETDSHSQLMLSDDELVELAYELNSWVNKVQANRSETP